MATKTGAGGQPQEYDAKTGEYGELVYDTEETRELYERIVRGDYLQINELRNHPVVKMLDEKAKEAHQHYGDTSLIQSDSRIKARKKRSFYRRIS